MIESLLFISLSKYFISIKLPLEGIQGKVLIEPKLSLTGEKNKCTFLVIYYFSVPRGRWLVCLPVTFLLYRSVLFTVFSVL